MAKARKKRTAYTPAQRKQILETALKEKLTAGQVQKRFGVTPVTYYSWRKKSGVARRRGRGPAAAVRAALPAATGGDLTGQVRSAVQARVRRLLPDILRGEVGAYLDSLFGAAGGARRRPRKKK